MVKPMVVWKMGVSKKLYGVTGWAGNLVWLIALRYFFSLAFIFVIVVIWH